MNADYILSGDAVFTVTLPAPVRGVREYTYRVQHVETDGRFPEAWFAKLLVGTDLDNPAGYAYLGKLDTWTSQVAHTPKSTLPASAFAFRLLNKVLARIWCGDAEAFARNGYVVRARHTLARELVNV